MALNSTSKHQSNKKSYFENSINAGVYLSFADLDQNIYFRGTQISVAYNGTIFNLVIPYSDVIVWASWRFKSLVPRLFVQ